MSGIEFITNYGEGPQHFGTLSVPDQAGPHPVVVLVHGGFWRAKYELDLMDPLAADLVGRGYAVWNIEYRRVGHSGGGYPGTLHDVAAATDHLAALAKGHDLDLERVAVVGHSAGGHLALWLGSRHMLAPGHPGAEPAVRPRMSIGQAAVADLAGAAAEGLGANATQDFMGGEPDELADVYAVAQPDVAAASAVLVHGTDDDTVPPDQSTRFTDDVEVVLIPGEGHMDVIDPTSQSWTATVEILARL